MDRSLFGRVSDLMDCFRGAICCIYISGGHNEVVNHPPTYGAVDNGVQEVNGDVQAIGNNASGLGDNADQA